MADTEENSIMGFDLGLRPIGEAVGQLISDLFHPMFQQAGLVAGDIVGAYRARRLLKILQETRRMLGSSDDVYAHPRMIREIVEHGSWVDDETLQRMWSGLLASSCTSDGNDDSNLLFANLLKQLSSSQVRILDYAVIHCDKRLAPRGLVITTESPICLSYPQLVEIAGIDDLERLDREFGHLNSLKLLRAGSGIHCAGDGSVTFNALPLACYLYVRCQGSRKTLQEFFDPPKM